MTKKVTQEQQKREIKAACLIILIMSIFLYYSSRPEYQAKVKQDKIEECKAYLEEIIYEFTRAY